MRLLCKDWPNYVSKRVERDSPALLQVVDAQAQQPNLMGNLRGSLLLGKVANYPRPPSSSSPSVTSDSPKAGRSDRFDLTKFVYEFFPDEDTHKAYLADYPAVKPTYDPSGGKRPFVFVDGQYRVVLTGKAKRDGKDVSAARLYDAASGKSVGPVVPLFEGEQMAAFAPDGKRAVFYRNLKMPDADKHRCIGSMIDLTTGNALGDYVDLVFKWKWGLRSYSMFTPDGRAFVYSEGDSHDIWGHAQCLDSDTYRNNIVPPNFVCSTDGKILYDNSFYGENGKMAKLPGWKYVSDHITRQLQNPLDINFLTGSTKVIADSTCHQMVNTM